MIHLRDINCRAPVYLFFVLAITFTVFSEAVSFDFTNWDDETHVTDNLLVKHLSFRNIKRIFTTTLQRTYIPLSTLSFVLEYHFFGLRPFVYHLNNIILHLAVTAGVYFLALRLGASVGAAAVAAFIFGIHPMHVESVAWITERKDVLYASFYMSAVLLYLGYQTHRRRYLLVLSVAAGFLSLLAKPMALSLPLILLVCDWFHKRRLTSSVLAEKIPYLAFIVPLAWISYYEQMRIPGESLIKATLIWIWTFVFYLKKFAIPDILLPLYQLPQPVTVLNPAYAGAIILLIAMVLVFWKYRRDRWLILAGLFYVASIFFLMRFDDRLDTHIVADRFMYLPSAGICIFLGITVQRIWTGVCRKRGIRRGIVVILFLIPALLLPWRSVNQIRIWKNSFTLWRYMIRHSPDEEIAWHNLAIEYSRHNLYAPAIKLFERALQVDPLYAEAYNNLGNIYFEQGNWVRAFWTFDQAIRIYPEYAEAYTNRGNLYALRQNLPKALHDFNMAVSLKPDHPLDFYNRANVLTEFGQYDLAIRDYTRCLELDPEFSKAYNNRGVLYYRQGMLEKARADFSAAFRWDPSNRAAFDNQSLVK